MKATELFLLGGLAYVFAASMGGFKPSPFKKVAQDTLAQIAAKEQAGVITNDEAQKLREQFTSINSTRSGVDFINQASRQGVFIQPRSAPRRVTVEGRREGESLRATAERQREALNAIVASEAKKTGVAKQSDAYYSARDRKKLELEATAKGSNTTADFSEIAKFQTFISQANAWIQRNPKPTEARAINDWRRSAENYKRRVLIRGANDLSSAIRRKLRDQKQQLPNYSEYTEATIKAEQNTKAEINKIINTR